jgi:hypothetical protein
MIKPREGLLTRRQICTGTLGCLVGSAAARSNGLDIAGIERERVTRAANRYLHEDPITITAYPAARSAGGRHDYFSEGDYWWPDPNNPEGPYIQRDGLTNPDNFVLHRHALIRLSVQMPALTTSSHGRTRRMCSTSMSFRSASPVCSSRAAPMRSRAIWPCGAS